MALSVLWFLHHCSCILCSPHCGRTLVFSSRMLPSLFRFADLSCSFQSRCVSFSSFCLFVCVFKSCFYQCKWWAPAKDFLTCVFYVSDYYLHLFDILDSLNLWFRSAPPCICSVFILKCFYCHFCSVCVCVHVSSSSSHTQVLLCFSLSLVSSVSVCSCPRTLSFHPCPFGVFSWHL